MIGIFQAMYIGIGTGFGELVTGRLYQHTGAVFVFRAATVWVLLTWVVVAILQAILQARKR